LKIGLNLLRSKHPMR